MMNPGMTRSQPCLLIATLIASQLMFACARAAQKSPEKNTGTARIISEIDVDDPESAVWCYDTEPAFVFSKGQTVFKYDTSGKLVWQITVPFEMGRVAGVSCSRDGKVLLFANSSGDRLSIYRPDNGLSQYAMSVPKLYYQSPDSQMSDDGNTFIMPSAPSIISGTDVLRNKRIVQTGGKIAYWTKDILFLGADEDYSYRMLRSNDLSDLGVLRLKPKSTQRIQGIFECGKNYFALYWKDELQRRDLERINDPRLPSNEAPTKFDDVGGVDQSDESCTVSLLRKVRNEEQLETVSILQDRVQERIDLRDIKRLADGLSVSRDRRFILGTHYLEIPTGAVDIWTGLPKPNDKRKVSRVVVLGIER